MKIFISQLNFIIGDIEGNTNKILSSLKKAKDGSVDIVVFSELAISGYPPEDLLLDSLLIEKAKLQIDKIAPFTKGLLVALGLPRKNPAHQEKFLFNSAAIFKDGYLIGFKDKELLPTYDVFDERRYFEPGKGPFVIEYKGKKIGITICEDAWQHGEKVGYTDYKKDPIRDLKNEKIDLLINLSASPYSFRRFQTRLDVFKACSNTLQCPVIVCNQVGANDQLVFDGLSFVLDGKGQLIAVAKGFEEDEMLIDLSEKQTILDFKRDPMKDLYQALVLGVKDYFQKQGLSNAILGLSGGIDSALVACIAVDALGPSQVTAYFLPSRYSSKQSEMDAKKVASNLGIAMEVISIDEIYQQYLNLLKPHFPDEKLDVTLENIQSRIRGMILMALSNKLCSILLSTGNKSEMAMGYTTLYGDMCGGLGVIQDVMKTKVFQLANFLNAQNKIIPISILKKAPSAELRPNQTDQDTLPPYEILDPILEDYIEQMLPLEEIAKKRGVEMGFIQKIIQNVHAQEFKRRQAPIGIRVTLKAFSKGRNVPIVQLLE